MARGKLHIQFRTQDRHAGITDEFVVELALFQEFGRRTFFARPGDRVGIRPEPRRLTAPTEAGQVVVGSDSARLGEYVGALLKDFEFIKTILFVGMPTKAILTGVIIFALGAPSSAALPCC